MSYFYMDFNEAIQLDTLWKSNMMLNFSLFIFEYITYSCIMKKNLNLISLHEYNINITINI